MEASSWNSRFFVTLQQETPNPHEDEETSINIVMCVAAGGVRLLIGREEKWAKFKTVEQLSSWRYAYH
ncbi:MAG: hypothetical protein IJQ48_05595 [Prevotella sp.]|nr:hypothetical protein [Prevotella sp.]